MKSYKSVLFVIVIGLSFSNTMHAQFLKKLKNRVQQASEQAVIDKLAQKGAQETGKKMDSLLKIDPNYQAKNQDQILSSFMQSSEDVKVEDSYKFDTNVIMKMVIEEKKEPTTFDYSMWFTKNDSYMATEISNMESKKSKTQKLPGGIITVIDDKNQAMIIVMAEQKMAQILSMESIKNIAVEETKGTDVPAPKITKTGKTKKILGYNCEEFKTKTENGDLTIWITQELRLFQKNMFANLNKSMGSNPFQNIPEAAKGFMMEMHSVSESGQKTSMYVKSISKKNKTINVKDYKLMNLSGFMKSK